MTLTSYGSRIASTAPNAIWSILQQSVLPDRIILWLGHDETISPQLRVLQEHGLEIRFCDDIGPYTKLIPALREFPNDVLITVDDDLYYPRGWFVQLKNAYLRDPTKIYCHRADEITLDPALRIQPYLFWKFRSANADTPQGRILLTGIDGVLYPPNALHPSVLDERKFMALAPQNDDVWFTVMAKLQGTPIAFVSNAGSERGPELHEEGGEMPLAYENLAERADRQLAAVLSEFHELYGWLEPSHIKMKLDLNDLVQRNIFFSGCWEKNAVEILLKIFPEQGVFFDIGANVGTYALNFAQKAKQVFAVEACLATHTKLAETVRANGLTNVLCYYNAVASVDGAELVIYKAEANSVGSNSVYRQQDEDVPLNTVMTVTLDTIVANNRIDRLDLIKIDVEGGELSALHGGELSIARFRPFIFAELNPVTCQRAGHTTIDLFNYITQDLHYTPTFIVGESFVPIADYAEYSDLLLDVFFIPAEKLKL